jgi:hypothetical protein
LFYFHKKIGGASENSFIGRDSYSVPDLPGRNSKKFPNIV